MKIESKVADIMRPTEEIFDFLTDFTHFSLLLPDKIENWKATKERCSFTIKGLTDFGMRITDTNPHNTITISNDEDIAMPIQFTFTWNFKPQASSCHIQICFELDANPMMAMVIKKPLANFVDILVDKLKEEMEKPNSGQ